MTRSKHKRNSSDLVDTKTKLENAPFQGPYHAENIVILDIVTALYEYHSKTISIRQDDIIYIISTKGETGWLEGILLEPKSHSIARGWLPQNYTRPIADPLLRDKYYTALLKYPRWKLEVSKPVLNVHEVRNFLKLSNIDPYLYLVWVPVYRQDPDNPSNDCIIYYNKDLEVYCDELPLLPYSNSGKASKNSLTVSSTGLRNNAVLDTNKTQLPILHDSNLIICHPNDISSWSQLFKIALEYIETLQKNLFFQETYESLCNSITYINISSHLIMKKTKKDSTNEHKEIKKTLKRVMHFISKISVITNLRYVYPDCHDSAASANVTLEMEYRKLKQHLLQLYELLSRQKFPQFCPRFFKDSFSGGSWNNPFHNSTTLQRINDKSLSLRQISPSSSTISTVSTNQSNNSLRLYARSFNRLKNNSSSTIRKPHTKFPLNGDTLKLLKSCLAKTSDNSCQLLSMIDSSTGNRTQRQVFEIISKTYEEINANSIFLNILENLNLSIFVNSIKLVKKRSDKPGISSMDEDDHETEQFLNHSVAAMSALVTDFFDIKQATHDIFIKLVMAAQQLSLEDEDPYVFNSIRSHLPADYRELIPTKKSNNRTEAEYASHLFKMLIKQDVENNDIDFLNVSQDLKETLLSYSDICAIAYDMVQQLIEESENLLNYSARMMKNDLIVELLRDFSDESMVHSTAKKVARKLSNFKKENGSDDDQYLNNIYTYYDGYDAYEDEDELPSQLQEKKNNLPWYLRPEHESELVFDTKRNVKGGMKEALIEYLTSPDIKDVEFTNTMLLTFRSMFTTMEFIYALVYRYNLCAPEGLCYDEFIVWIEQKLTPIKTSVVTVLKQLCRDYWQDAYYEHGMSSILNFANVAESENVEGSEELVKIVEKLLSEQKSPTNNAQSSEACTHTSVAPSNSIFRLKKLKQLDIEPQLYATQLTILEQEIYLQIKSCECLDRAWGKKYCDFGGSPNISKFVTCANHLTNYVSHTIVKTPDVKKRSRLIQYFITVAKICNDLNNFSSMTAIISALYSSPIFRLKKTWALISAESKEDLDKLNTLMDSTKNFINYRKLVRSLKGNAPCVPFFGVYLSDLTFTSAGNPDFLHGSTNIINFSKRTKVASILEEILHFQKLPYKLKRNDEILWFIDHSLKNVPHIETQYQLSLSIEPRENNNSNKVDTTGGVPHSGFKAGSDGRSGKLLKFTRITPASRLFG